MPFDYYQRLSARDKRTYRRSDGVVAIPVPDAARLEPMVVALRVALEKDERGAVERAAQALCLGITRRFGVQGVRIKVLAVRPTQRDGELHGLYTLEHDGRAHIEVWMRTARHGRVVAFRTFLRTLLHELCHHLDLTLLELPETFHTEGFFRRESSLFRQLVPAAPRRPPKPSKPASAEDTPKNRAAKPRRQLTLFD
jgi:hypothetical protein